MNTLHAWFRRPESPGLRLRVPPRLASWNATTSPAQHQLAAYLADTEDLLAPTLAQLTGPWTLRLDVGIASGKPLLDAADVDNYLYPLTRYLQRNGGPAPEGLVSVWCTKQHADPSWVQAAPATPAAEPPPLRFTFRTTASATTTAFKQQIHDAAAKLPALPDGPVRLELSYLVGDRNWINLWKPTIDALDPLLGRTTPTQDWHPKDGRITELGLHAAKDPTLGYGVEIQVRAEPAST